MECRETEALFTDFVRATINYIVATEELANLIGSKERFAEARRRVQETEAECKAAQSALMEHREHHNCGTSSVETANPSDQHPD